MNGVRQSVDARRELERSGWGLRLVYYASLAVISGLAVLSLVPLGLMFLGSFTSQHELLGLSHLALPKRLILENYVHLFSGRFPLWRWLANSILVSGASALGVCLFGAPAGYALAKGKFKGMPQLMALVILSMAVPRYLALVPLFTLVRQLGLANSLWGMIVPFLAVPMGLFYFRQIMLRVSDELLDAARLDGASEMGLLWHVVWPQVRPSVAAIAVINFIARWRDYVWQSVIAAAPAHYTLPVGVARLVSTAEATDFGLAMAGAVLAFVPLLVAFLLAQEKLVRGLASATHE